MKWKRKKTCFATKWFLLWIGLKCAQRSTNLFLEVLPGHDIVSKSNTIISKKLFFVNHRDCLEKKKDELALPRTSMLCFCQTISPIFSHVDKFMEVTTRPKFPWIIGFNVCTKKCFTSPKKMVAFFFIELCPKGHYHVFQANPNQKRYFPHVDWKFKFLLRNLTLLFVFGKNKALLFEKKMCCYCWRWFCLKRHHFNQTKRLFNKLSTGSVIFF